MCLAKNQTLEKVCTKNIKKENLSPLINRLILEQAEMKGLWIAMYESTVL